VSVADGNSSAAQKIQNSNTTQALLADLEARGYKLSVNERGNLSTEPDGPPMTPVIWHALQANYTKLVSLLRPKDVTNSNREPEPNVRKDNTDWSRVADLMPARGEERERAVAEYRALSQVVNVAVKAAGPKDFIEGMMMHSVEMDKRRSGRDIEAERRIEAAKKGGACAKCGKALEDGETVYAKCRVYAGMWGSLTPRPGLRFVPAPVCEGCAPKWMSQPKTFNEYTINGRTVRVPEHGRVGERPCSTCERPVVYELTRRDYHGRHVFCSYRCQYTYHNRRRSQRDEHLRQKVCEVCGVEFTATRAHAKTCSPACKQKAYRRRRARA
jgi:hypothetical protein